MHNRKPGRPPLALPAAAAYHRLDDHKGRVLRDALAARRDVGINGIEAPPGPGGSGWSGRTAREQGLGDRRVSGQDDRLVRLPPITEHARTRRAAREGPWHRPDRQALANMCQFANARTPAPTSSARWTSPRCCAAGNGPRVWPTLGRWATARGSDGTRHPAQAAPQERVVTHAQNSHRRQGGSRRPGSHACARTRGHGGPLHRSARTSATTDATTRGRGWRLDGRSG